MVTDISEVSCENQKQECRALPYYELMLYDCIVMEKASDSMFYLN